MKINELHQVFLKCSGVCTDTRKIKSGDLFFALKGDNFNGNEYAEEALAKGAAYAVIDEEKYSGNQKILVEDVLKTLQELANYHRRNSSAKIIGLTGSNGKTTTKELINSVLSQKYRTVATSGNLNNHIGVPLTLLSIEENTEIAIVEMGANHQKEIAFLCSIAEPDFGYITNFGKAHLEGFGGVEGVIKGKSELYDFLMVHDKVIFMNADDPIQKEKLGDYIKKYGFSTMDQRFYPIHLISANPFVSIKAEGITILSNLIGEYNFTNCCAAIIMGKYFNVELKNIKAGIEGYVPANNRSQIIDRNEHMIILDAYNANPTSMSAALQNFAKMSGRNKILFLGDMFELGESAHEEHQKIADLIKQLGFDNVFLVGKNFFKVKSEFPKLGTFDQLKQNLESLELPKSTILIKGSRGMALERILELI
ncbi:UDP-N-acetylmuramoyl-tripeptide--D-alanyl-D-alanine ligase [Maribacter cobaltidurans]|uniref:UDP-N-acetylmuramoyl-tripeptide--D-alanyl-D-alanine ligase n=1 Tax=Maribacter cobaltidurans TaxID=1178778 RepID=A0A223V6J4_9FLAO|nr:UDP-N-acetylmuramoyl-tripeptide--D-alanyl-D-alanine ligase [Maribacter cobaltidurans]ASV31043.1 UDP-N-acetylmuramoyl-tripeptide--D-alanyl-D-alanine ligase [Maribacter cobaltidurans]GGD96291.1 UDP-N-acetylmuramoyl-tripeptide--D-alanyl-D-alanine ligase [Maribacter cobaltidurans]